jgi:hypothetical protein
MVRASTAFDVVRTLIPWLRLGALFFRGRLSLLILAVNRVSS